MSPKIFHVAVSNRLLTAAFFVFFPIVPHSIYISFHIAPQFLMWKGLSFAMVTP